MRKRDAKPKPGAQLALPLPKKAAASGWGGKRTGAGRPRKHPGGNAPMPHDRRPDHAARCPVLVTLRATRGLPSFRTQVMQRRLKEMLSAQGKRDYGPSFQVVHFSIQTNHLHLIVEAKGATSEQIAASPRLLSKRAARGRETRDRDMLRRGIAGLAISFARRLNRLLQRKGAVWAERHHRRDLATPSEVRNTLVYVLQNWRRHGAVIIGGGVCDPCSSGVGFEGWEQLDSHWNETEPWSPRPRTWLLGIGWRRAGGSISTHEGPPLSEHARVPEGVIHFSTEVEGRLVPTTLSLREIAAHRIPPPSMR